MAQRTRARRHAVIGGPGIPRKGRPLIWAFGLGDLAAFYRLTIAGVRRAIREGRLDPSSLDSVMAFHHRKQRSKA